MIATYQAECLLVIGSFEKQAKKLHDSTPIFTSPTLKQKDVQMQFLEN